MTELELATGVTDPEGRSRSYQYTADRVTQSTDADGHKTTYVYDYDKQKKEFYVRVTGPAGADGSRISLWQALLRFMVSIASQAPL